MEGRPGALQPPKPYAMPMGNYEIKKENVKLLATAYGLDRRESAGTPGGENSGHQAHKSGNP